MALLLTQTLTENENRQTPKVKPQLELRTRTMAAKSLLQLKSENLSELRVS